MFFFVFVYEDNVRASGGVDIFEKCALNCGDESFGITKADLS